MRIAAISDVHGKWNKLGNIEPCDILISAGDYSFTGEKHMVEDFHKWLNKQPTKHIISVQGNHECFIDKMPQPVRGRISSLTFSEAKELAQSVCPRVHFIGDGETVVIDGIKIHGSACTPWFHSWAWNRLSWELKEEWAKIPDDTDILITHGPAYGILDTVNFADGTPKSEHLGCQHLMDRIREIKPDLHIFGHIHSSHGIKHHEGVSFYNASCCDEMYVASNPVTYIDYEKD
jgi:Icc-related predicted phosphoesterase